MATETFQPFTFVVVAPVRGDEAMAMEIPVWAPERNAARCARLALYLALAHSDRVGYDDDESDEDPDAFEY